MVNRHCKQLRRFQPLSQHGGRDETHRIRCKLPVRTMQCTTYGLGQHVICSTGLQVELHPLPRMEQGGGADPEAVPDELWHWQVGADTGHGPFAWQNDSAAQRADAAPPWAAGPGRWGHAPVLTGSSPPCPVLAMAGQLASCTAAFNGLQLDIDRVRADNDARTGVRRKAGLIIHTGGELSHMDSLFSVVCLH